MYSTQQLVKYNPFLWIKLLILNQFVFNFQEAEVAELSQGKWEIWLQHLQIVHRGIVPYLVMFGLPLG